MTRPLSGAAASAHTRRIILDEARAAITRRDPHAVSDTVALLRLVDAKTPRKAPVEPEVPLVVTRYTGHGLGHHWTRPDIRMTPLTTPSRVPTPGPQVTTAHEHGHRVPRMGREL